MYAYIKREGPRDLFNAMKLYESLGIDSPLRKDPDIVDKVMSVYIKRKGKVDLYKAIKLYDELKGKYPEINILDPQDFLIKKPDRSTAVGFSLSR